MKGFQPMDSLPLLLVASEFDELFSLLLFVFFFLGFVARKRVEVWIFVGVKVELYSNLFLVLTTFFLM